MIFLGLDGEMTGSDFPRYSLIQIGVALGPKDVFTSDIGHDRWEEHPKAMEVNGFTRDRILAAPRPDRVDADLNVWLKNHNIPEGQAVAVGFGVGRFDMPFFRRDLPISARHFKFITVDLTSECITAGEIRGQRWTTIKKHAKEWAEDELMALGIEPNHHDAGYDAALALKAWEWIRKALGG